MDVRRRVATMDARCRFDAVAAVGLPGWLLVTALVPASVLSLDGPTTATLAVVLAAFVVVPLVAGLADLPYRTGARSVWYRTASLLCFPSAFAALVSLALTPGAAAAVLAVPWLVVTGALAVFGLQRGLPNLLRPSELGISVALVYLPVAGVALVVHRAGATVGFGATTMLLTVVHFHYAGCALPAFVGLLGREHGGVRTYRALLAPVLLGPGIIGLGIAFSPTVELVAASAFAVVVAAIAVYALGELFPPSGSGHVLVCVAAVAVAVSMGAVVAYLLSLQTALELLGFEAMLAGHGWLNAVGFALAGLVGWRLVDPESGAPPLGMPLSRFTARGRVGADYLERSEAVVEGDAAGMVDSFRAFDGPACESSRIADEVRAFYERTGAYDLRIEPSWEPGFRLGARLYARFGRHVEQMNFPVDARDPERLSSRIVPVDDGADGRPDVRAWIRTYDETGAAIYVALYATHRLDGRPYMNIAFPLPYSNLTSVLTVEPLNVADPDGVVLSTTGGGDAGIYLRTPFGPLRIPMNETIRVWSSGMNGAFPNGFEDDGSDIFARHEMFLFGRRFLRLDYRITELRRSTLAAPDGD